MCSHKPGAVLVGPDPFLAFKAVQRQGWSHSGPLAFHTTAAAARLVRFACIAEGQRVLDVGSGNGVVAVTAARLGARVVGTDYVPELLVEAAEHSRLAGVEVDWRFADVEALPFPDARFDAVLSQFGHMFAPRPKVALGEMLRVLEPGGTIAFSTWPPVHFAGRLLELAGRYLPPPHGVASPLLWGDPESVREQLDDAVEELHFEYQVMRIDALSPRHVRQFVEHSMGPVRTLVDTLGASEPERLERFRREFDDLTSQYFEANQVRQTFLMTRGKKRRP